MQNNITQTLKKLQFGEVLMHKNMAVLPIVGLPKSEPQYITLKKGLSDKLISITEVSESGSVPNLKVNNDAAFPLFLIDGEELVGAKQNRIVNSSLLLEAKSSTVIPVSCTESGRWSYNSRAFHDSGVVMSSRARHAKSVRLSKNLSTRQEYTADQSEVWKDIETYHGKFATNSSTRAMKDAFEKNKNNLSVFQNAFPVQAGQNGLAVFINGELLGVDWVSLPEAYADLHEKLIQSYAIEAIDNEDYTYENFDFEDATIVFLNDFVSSSKEEVFKPVGLGQDYRYEVAGGLASALIEADTVVHFSGINGKDKSLDKAGASSRSQRLNRKRKLNPLTSRTSSNTKTVPKVKKEALLDKIKIAFKKK